MRWYRNLWLTTVVVLAAGSFAMAGAALGWTTTIATTAAFILLGAMFGFSWVEDPRRRAPAMGRGAMWFGIVTVLVLGLPAVLGAWSMLLLLTLGAGTPELIEYALRAYRKASPAPVAEHPEGISSRDLARRWRCTSDQLLDRSTSPVQALALVEERARLLDEMERRDPAGFDQWLVRSGWREPEHR